MVFASRPAYVPASAPGIGATSALAVPVLVVALALLVVYRTRRQRQAGRRGHPKARSYVWSGQVEPVDGGALPPPIKYRPFKWGAYHVTMGLNKVGFQDWIVLDSDFVRYFTLRRWRMARSGPDSVRLLPSRDGGNLAAAQELADEVAAYLCTKYPSLFSWEPSGGAREGGRAPPALVLSEQYVAAVRADNTAPRAGRPDKDGGIKTRYPLGTAEECLEMVGSVVPDDVLLLRPLAEQDGQYVLVGGVTCTAGTWRLKDKIGMTLAEIHTSGHVPRYERQLKPGMDKLFARMGPAEMVARSNYGFQIVRNTAQVDPHELAHLPYGSPGEADVAEAAWATTGFGPEHEWEHQARGEKGALALPGQEEEEAAHATAAATNGADSSEGTFDVMALTHADVFHAASQADQKRFVEHVQMRTERQTVRRLPRSGAMVFTVHTYVVPVVTMAQEPGVPARLVSALRSWPEDTFRYKGGWKWRDQLATYLGRVDAQQRAQGVVPDTDRDRARYPL